jgi:hypothetical protein
MGLRKGGGGEKVSGEVVEYESGKGRKSCVCNWQKHNYKMLSSIGSNGKQ